MLERYRHWTNDCSSAFEWVHDIELYTLLKIKVTLQIILMFVLVLHGDVLATAILAIVMILTSSEEIAIYERDEAYKIRKINE